VSIRSSRRTFLDTAATTAATFRMAGVIPRRATMLNPSWSTIRMTPGAKRFRMF
jgi:hypothetical protein